MGRIRQGSGLGRLGVHQWPPKSHKFPITFDLGQETVGVLKNINVNLLDYYKKSVEHSKQKATNHKFHWECEHVKDFDLRFYLPLNVMSLPGQKIQKVVIMINGLNEIYPMHFAHYDRIGASLALRGLGAILYATPFHLNRVSYLKEEFKNEYEQRGRQNWPRGAEVLPRLPHNSMIRRPEALFACFQQTSEELISFANYLCGKSPFDFATVDDNDELFYEELFDSANLSISLLGYSLGGLQALYTFLKNPKVFDRCILLNSGASIRDLNPKPVGIEDEKWLQIIDQSNKARFHLLDKYNLDLGDDSELLNDVLFERPFEDTSTKAVFRDNAHKLLFVAGGADIVSPADYLLQFLPHPDGSLYATDFRGLNILQVEGLGHPVQHSLDYDRWFPVIIDTIDKFLHSPNPRQAQYSHEGLLKRFLEFKIESKAWDVWCQDNGLLDREDQNLNVVEIVKHLDDKYKKEFVKHYIYSKRYFVSDSDLLHALEREKRSTKHLARR